MIQLPKPIGVYNVGVKQFDFMDESRIQVFSFEEPNSPRKIPVYIYYPGDNSEGADRAFYVTEEEAEIIHLNYQKMVPKNISDITTFLYKEVPISDHGKTFPVIIYNHGYGAFMQNNTVLLSNLASLGYIVVSVGHPYEAGVVRYQNGEIVTIAEDHVKLIQYVSNKDQLNDLIQRQAAIDEEFLRDEKEYYGYLHPDFHKHVDIWVSDCKFVLDKLEQWNNGDDPSMFEGKLDFSNGIAIIGHSYGGSTSGQACWKDDRFSCGVNIDSLNYGEYAFQDINAPFLAIGQPSMERFAKSTFLMNSKDSYMVLINEVAHVGFTDASYIIKDSKVLELLFRRDTFEFHRIFTKYIISFLDRYLKRSSDAKIEDYGLEGVRFISNVNKNNHPE